MFGSCTCSNKYSCMHSTHYMYMYITCRVIKLCGVKTLLIKDILNNGHSINNIPLATLFKSVRTLIIVVYLQIEASLSIMDCPNGLIEVPLYILCVLTSGIYKWSYFVSEPFQLFLTWIFLHILLCIFRSYNFSLLDWLGS